MTVQIRIIAEYVQENNDKYRRYEANIETKSTTSVLIVVCNGYNRSSDMSLSELMNFHILH